MIYLKSREDIGLMKESGKILRRVVGEVMPFVSVGRTTKWIDKKCEQLIRKYGGEPSFKKVKGYDWATCLSINDQIVHTPPSDRVLVDGDLLTIDIGVYYRGFHTDYAKSLIIGQSGKPIQQFLQVGRQTLAKAIKQFKVDNHIGHISRVIEKEIYGAGYYVVKQLTGHGVGRGLHEDPVILGYLDKPVEQTPLIEPGLAVAIEIIYSMGTEGIEYEDDNWSLVTDDGSISACFEKTVVVDGKKTLILT